MGDVWLFIILVGGLWYWWDTLHAKEIARLAGLQACQNAAVQFLDDTVERKKVWLRRSRKGSLQLCRLYFFEFSSDGAERYQGRITMLAQKVKEVEMDAYRIPSE